jgi:hypothetical protein
MLSVKVQPTAVRSSPNPALGFALPVKNFLRFFPKPLASRTFAEAFRQDFLRNLLKA